MSARRRALAGFTLLEMSLTLLIVGILLAGLMLPLQGQVEDRQFAEARVMLEQAREALLTFASEYGYLPCPADAASGGMEPAAGVNHATGACPAYHGFLPARLIGYTPLDPDGYAVDPWGSAAHRIRYAVFNQPIGGIATPLTRARGMAAAGAPSIGAGNDLFYVCGSGNGVTPGTNCGTAQTLTSNAVVVLWSVGPNGGSGGASVHEAENPNPNGGSADRIFVSRPRLEGAGADFDDVVVWLSSLMLVKRMVAAGQLP